jgi:6-phosphofructokinase 2
LLTSTAPRPDFVVASGSLPPGVPEDFFGRVARIAKTMAAQVIVDSSGPALKAALNEGVYLIKPNLRELWELTSTTSADDVELVAAGRSLIERGLVELIALTLGPNGAVLIARDQAVRRGWPSNQPALSGQATVSRVR